MNEIKGLMMTDITKEIKGIGMLFIKTKVKTPLAWVTLNDYGYPV